jgi:two-component system phosphate regulon sensor histidine kinase PhoR
MLIVSAGLICAQVVWIFGVYGNIRNEMEAKANESLANVVHKVWQEETLTQIYDDIDENLSGQKAGNDGHRNLIYISRSGAVIHNNQIDSVMQADSIIKNEEVKDILEKDTEKGLLVKKYFVESVLEKLVYADIPVEQRVTIEQLDTLLVKELERVNLTEKFRVAICDRNGRNIIASAKYDAESSPTLYRKQLFPNDPEGFSETYFVAMYFPGEMHIIIHRILPLVVSSFVLTAFILSIFIYTVYVISQQKKISEIKNDFISNITHELKTPIATVSLAAQMLGDESIPQSMKNIPKLSKMIKEQGKQLSYLVEKVLQTSVFERQAIVFNKQNVSLHSMIKEADDIMTLQMRSRKATLMTKLKATNDVISTDKAYFVTVITNLLDNALKYSREVPRIEIGTRNEDGKVLCYVSDNGIGISEENTKKIFEQFFRVYTGNVHDVKGFGLGLSYVKKIVELSGGLISVESEINKGTTFYIWLPCI